MNTIAIDSNIYKGAESYAKLHNISVTAAIEKAISLRWLIKNMHYESFYRYEYLNRFRCKS